MADLHETSSNAPQKRLYGHRQRATALRLLSTDGRAVCVAVLLLLSLVVVLYPFRKIVRRERFFVRRTPRRHGHGHPTMVVVSGLEAVSNHFQGRNVQRRWQRAGGRRKRRRGWRGR